MGAACCVAAKDRSITNRTGGESLHRDVTRSPSWSFRWDSLGRVADEVQNPSYPTSHVFSRNTSMEFKGSLSSARGNLSDGGSMLDNSATISLKSPVSEALAANVMTPSSDLSMSSNFSPVVKNPGESSIPNHSFSIPSVFSTPIAGPLSNHGYQHLHNSTPTKSTNRSLGHPLLRQISDNQIMGLKSPDSSIYEGRVSFVLSTCSNEIEAISQCGSSDGWSMHTFSELVASSQRGRWSFDSECFGSGRRKISGSSSRLSYSPSMDLQSCGTCTRLLSDKSAWGNHKFIGNNDLSVVAVLICGHAFHADCLETTTAEADKYDPSCPICLAGGDKHFPKFSRKGFRAEADMKAKNHKISRNRVVDSYLDGGLDVFDRQKDIELGGKVSKMEASSSTRSSVGKPFLKKHFSLGSKWNRSLFENDSARKKGFWARYKKD